MIKILSLGFCVVALAACGTSSSQTAQSNSSSSNSTGSTGVSTGSGNWQNLPPAWSEQVYISGVGGPYQSTTITLSPTAHPGALSVYQGTSNLLKVKVQPLSAPNMVLDGYQQYNFPYGCLQMNVTVNGAVQTTSGSNGAGIKVPGAGDNDPLCKTSATYQVLDFSQEVALGGGPISVTINQGVYDNCRQSNTWLYGCFMAAIFQNHVAAAKVTIQTNGTYMDLTQ